MSSTPKTGKYVHDTIEQQQLSGSSGSTRATTGSGHKPSFKSTKLARRARSFKEDFLEKISQMRNNSPITSATSTPVAAAAAPGITMMGRRSGDQHHKQGGDLAAQYKGPMHEFELLSKQIQTALNYFRNAVANGKVEMLAGNGTIILDTVWAINLSVKSSGAAGNGDNSTAASVAVCAATRDMYQSVARLIKLCDDALMDGDSVLLGDGKKEEEEEGKKREDGVEEVLATLEKSVKELLHIAREQLSLQTTPNSTPSYKTTPRSSTHYQSGPGNGGGGGGGNSNLLANSHNRHLSIQSVAPQRNSLPDIPLTPRDRQLLEEAALEAAGKAKGEGEVVRNSHSSESVLRDSGGGSSPPPKPPLPDGILRGNALIGGCLSPPPLPPKKKFNCRNMQIIDACHMDSMISALERSSLHSRSPDDSISLLSASAGSLDSMLNHSREDDEIKALMDHNDSDTVLDNDISDSFGLKHPFDLSLSHFSSSVSPPLPQSLLSNSSRFSCINTLTTSTSTSTSNSSNSQEHHQQQQQSFHNQQQRLSNTDSGIVSLHSSVRNSACSKRSSQQSATSVVSGNTTGWNVCRQMVSSSSMSTEQLVKKSESVVVKNNCEEISSYQQQQHQCSSTTSSSSSMSLVNASGGMTELVDGAIVNDPPAIPQKTRRKATTDRQPSPYDNVPESHLGGELLVPCQMHQSHQSLSSSASSTLTSTLLSQDNGKPPPLPPKKKHIMAYMEMFGNCSHSNDQEFMRHSVHMVHNNWSQPMGLPTAQSCSFTRSTSSSCTSRTQSLALHQLSTELSPLPSSPLNKSPRLTLTTQSSIPPALPPKRHRTTPSIPSLTTLTTPPPSPRVPSPHATSHSAQLLEEGAPLHNHNHPSNNNPTITSTIPTASCNNNVLEQQQLSSATIITTTTPTIQSESSAVKSVVLPDLLEHTTSVAVATIADDNKDIVVGDALKAIVKPATSGEGIVGSKKSEDSSVVGDCYADLIEELDVEKYLVLKKADEDMPDIRGGAVDALIIQATRATRNCGFTYQEAFLTTYRTFITPHQLIDKLIRRYYFFYGQPDKKKRSREAFALIVRVVNDLISSDLNRKLQQTIMDFVQKLISAGELTLAKALRVKLLEKHDVKMNAKLTSNNQSSVIIAPSLVGGPRNTTLLDCKSEQIAEQMTLLDAELFMKIEIPEVLTWVQEQKEDTSPNLTRFTEHFNKMSYWARTRILSADSRDREKYFLKYIKIMKHLRKINNFNSYLALLSALDSAPVRRLDWQRHVQDGLREYGALIDSSSSFRAYRQALADTLPPCIPYIGLVLQDLTFVHIGNSNLLQNGAINFSKRWQQFNIVENMKRFKKCSYSFKRNDRIIAYFQNFDEYISEDEMWYLSESIKPRGGKKTTQ